MADASVKFVLKEIKTHWSDIKSEWLSLFEACENPCMFYHPGFLDAALLSPKELRPTHLFCGYLNGTLVFGVPGNLGTRAGTKEFSFFSGPGFDHLAPLDSSRSWDHSLNFFRSSLARGNFSSYKIDFARESFFQMAQQFRGGKSFSRPMFRCPFFPLPENSEDLLSPFNSKFRSNLKRRMRLLDELNVTFRIRDADSGAENLLNSFQKLLELHIQRSDKKEIDSQFNQELPVTFFKNLCRSSTHYPGMLKFAEAVKDDEVIGSLMGFSSKEAFHFHQHGFSGEYSRYALGSVLIYRMMEESVKNNLKTFDFLRGADDYKFFWTKSFSTDYFFTANITPSGIPSIFQHKLRYYRRHYGKVKGTLMGIFSR